MPQSWNEIKSRAFAFSKEWQEASNENAEAKSFWDDFFNIFGVSRRRIASFEQRVKKIDGKDGYIDLLWKGVMLIEHKSRGKNLDRAHQQALDYFPGLKERELPRYILVSDFARFRLYDLDDGNQHEFSLEELHKHIRVFGFIAGYQTHKIQQQDPVNIKAAERMGTLHDQLKAVGYSGHPLEIYLVRLLFCMFAEDTGIFERQQFQDFIENNTREDGADLGDRLSTLFYVLNTPPAKRLKNRDESLTSFCYINGKLFEEMLPPASFDAVMRQTMLDCCALDWSRISPAIFGSLFQSIMDKRVRRNLGAHYTSEENILKLIRPLFYDALLAEFESVKNNNKRLAEFHKKLRALTFLDPACGCGNFLVIAYRELRLLELEILRASHQSGQQALDVHGLIYLDVDQFYGIEIEEFPAQIAQVALWLIDHQMNLRVSEEFGQYFARIPLQSSPNIIQRNALNINWNEVIPAKNLSYLLGNPPFSGAMVMGDSQRQDQAAVLSDIQGAGVLDFVSCWYWLAAKYIQGTTVKAGFVSTNSIIQGEQVNILWPNIFEKLKSKINFAHRTFRWSNESRGMAAVHCVIIGFSNNDENPKRLFHYESARGEPLEVEASNINAYLVDAPDIFLANRSSPICPVPPMKFGNMPRDGGYLLLSPEEREIALAAEPAIAPYIKLFLGAKQLLNSEKRYCIWLLDANPLTITNSPFLKLRINAVRKFRLASKAASTRRFGETPSIFAQIAQPKGSYILVPRHSSEARKYIPIAFFGQENIVADSCLSIDGASIYHFGILTSLMHNAWVRAVCGRIKSDYRYSKDIVYNNYPWPENPTAKQIQSVSDAAQAVIDARAKFPDTPLATLYDPLSMPVALTSAHQNLDRAVDAAYGKRSFTSEAERVSFLFALYQKYTTPACT